MPEGKERDDHCYCHTSTVEESMLLCKACKKSFHPGCLKSGRPSNLLGDVYFRFQCATCSSTGEESCERIKLQWTIVVALSLYNLQLQGSGKRGCYRWREHICNFIDRHWTVFFGEEKKKTATWHGTVAGTLSSGCPALFVSGMESLGEPGWWSLRTTRLPTLEEVEAMVATHKAGKRRKGGRITLPTPFPLVDGLRSRKNTLERNSSCAEQKGIQVCFQEKHESAAKKRKNLGKSEKRKSSEKEGNISTRLNESEDQVLEWLEKKTENMEMEIVEGNLLPMEDFCIYHMDVDIPKSDVLSEIFCDSSEIHSCNEIKFETLEQLPQNVKYNFEQCSLGASDDDKHIHAPLGAYAKKLQTAETGRKRKAMTKHEPLVQQQQKCPRLITMSHNEEQQMLKKLLKLAKIVDTIPEAGKLRQKLKIRELKRERNIPLFDFDTEVKKLCGDKFSAIKESFESNSSTLSSHTVCNILDRYQIDCVPYKEMTAATRSFPVALSNDSVCAECFISPYSLRLLEPVIWQDYEVLPPKLKLMLEIINFVHTKKKNGMHNLQPPLRDPIKYCYVRPHHVPIVNSLCQEFFWHGIDLSECLQYPEFSCVALYKRIIVGFAFILPESYPKANEAYISYMLVHPDWQNVGIFGLASFMLYHLIETCTVRGIHMLTTHAAPGSALVLLYQEFGFKIVECIEDFFDKYLPSNSTQCRAALLLRLSIK